ncbi:MAG: hypothetical protein U0169_20660 [Polyangiaceae bacterium]
MKTLARPMGTAAFRISERLGPSLSVLIPKSAPQIFVHEGARQSLERRLKAAHPGPVVLSITDNRHSMISHRCENGVLQARIHHMFLDSPRSVVDALVRYVVQNDREASAVVGHFIDENGHRVVKRSRNAKLETRGKHHDLLAIFHDLNEKYFGGSVNTLITWGKKPTRKPGTPRHSMKLGSYTAAERLIRIHPSLDRAWVPRYFVAFVIFHEMLHHVIPATPGPDGRSNLHPEAFRARERTFRHYERARVWEHRFIARLLRS